jgi:hypothetical protein
MGGAQNAFGVAAGGGSVVGRVGVAERSTGAVAVSLDVLCGELTRRRFDTGAVEPVVLWLAGLHAPVRACYEAGPTGFRAVSGGGGGGDRLSGDRAQQDAAPVGRSQQVRPPRRERTDGRM